MKYSKYYKKKKTKKSININKIINKFLISIIILLSSLILCNINKQYKDYYHNRLLNTNISFHSFKKILNKFGKKENKEELLVSNITYNQIEQLEDKTIIKYDMEPAYYLKPGIIVFIGEKDDLGKTIIVQGNDGVDIWYSNLDTINNDLYDYVNANNIIGTLINGELIITIEKSGTKITYEEYMEN